MPPGDSSQFNAEVGQMVAAGWERHRDRLFENSRPVSEWLVQQIDPKPGATVLELAAGPGETGFLVAERIGSAGRLISTDVAPAMVDTAKRGAEARGLHNIEFRVVDAQAIDLADDSVDGVLSRFGVMLTPDPRRVLSEARRVLRPGRPLAYAVWGAPDRNPWLMLVVGALLQRGHVPPGDAFGPGGVFSLAESHDNEELMGEAGYSDVQVAEIAGFMRFESVSDYWELQSAVSGPVAVLAKSLEPREVDTIRAVLEQALAPFESGSGYDVPSLAVGVSGAA